MWFTIKVKHRSTLVNVSVGDYIHETGIHTCSLCDKSFKSAQGLYSHVYWAHSATISANKSETALKAINAKIERDVKLTADKLILSVVENSSPVITTTNNNDTETIDFNVDGSSSKEAHEKEKKKRKQYNFVFKMDITEHVESGIQHIDVAFNGNIDKSLVSRWIQSKKNIISGASDQHRKLFKKNRKSTKHETLFKKLSDLKKQDQKGLKVSFSWLYTKANIINKKLSQNSKGLSKTVVVMFLRKFNIKLRRVQRKKQIDKSKFAPEMMKWHCTLREGVIKSCSHLLDYGPKWSRFPPNKRVNGDQIPLPFDINRTTTYEEEIPKELRKYQSLGSKSWSRTRKTAVFSAVSL